jgi:hypothetical protein
MSTANNKKANSKLTTPIELILRNSHNLPPEELAQKIAETLSGGSSIYYSPKNGVSLLTAPARVLVTIIEEPNITIRALSIYLGISEAAVLKSLKLLLDKGLIAKTKVNGKNNYSIVKESFENNSDIIHIIRAAAMVSGLNNQVDSDDIFE